MRGDRRNPRSFRLKNALEYVIGEKRFTFLLATGPRPWRTRVDPFQDVWLLLEQWLNEQPDATAKALFQRLQAQTPKPFAAGQLRTLQRRVREWRTAIARRLVLGASDRAEVSMIVCNSEPSA